MEEVAKEHMQNLHEKDDTEGTDESPLLDFLATPGSQDVADHILIHVSSTGGGGAKAILSLRKVCSATKCWVDTLRPAQAKRVFSKIPLVFYLSPKVLKKFTESPPPFADAASSMILYCNEKGLLEITEKSKEAFPSFFTFWTTQLHTLHTYNFTSEIQKTLGQAESLRSIHCSRITLTKKLLEVDMNFPSKFCDIFIGRFLPESLTYLHLNEWNTKCNVWAPVQWMESLKSISKSCPNLYKLKVAAHFLKSAIDKMVFPEYRNHYAFHNLRSVSLKLGVGVWSSESNGWISAASPIWSTHVIIDIFLVNFMSLMKLKLDTFTPDPKITIDSAFTEAILKSNLAQSLEYLEIMDDVIIAENALDGLDILKSIMKENKLRRLGPEKRGQLTSINTMYNNFCT